MVLQKRDVGEDNIDAIQATVNGIQDNVTLVAESSKQRFKQLEDYRQAGRNGDHATGGLITDCRRRHSHAESRSGAYQCPPSPCEIIVQY
eukprot:COSAG05_NODE_1421_length_4927_cov_3.941384_2_plen_90_part_00